MAACDLSLLRDQATEQVVGALNLRYPGLIDRSGARSRTAWREDIQRHLENLQAALDCGDGRLFGSYAVWLADMLGSRNVAVAHLAESFELLAEFLLRELPPAPAAAAAAILTEAARTIVHPPLPMPYFDHLLPPLADSEGYRRRALAGEHRAAQDIVDQAMRAGHDYAELAVRLIQPAMYQIGRLWQQNQVSVAQEHLATAVTQNVLVRTYMQAEFAAANGRKALFACVETNRHGLGLRMLADTFEIAGWEIACLGADVPTVDLISQVDLWRPDLLALSITLPQQIAVARAAIARLRGEMGGRTPAIYVGGLATNVADPVWRSLAADGWAANAIDTLKAAGR